MRNDQWTVWIWGHRLGTGVVANWLAPFARSLQIDLSKRGWMFALGGGILAAMNQVTGILSSLEQGDPHAARGFCR